MISELAGRVFQARNVVHARHWATKSYAEHVALGAFYADIIDAADTLVETYIGQFGPFEVTYTTETEPVSDIAAYLQEESDWIESNRSQIANDSPCIENLVDSLTAIYCKTVFLLGMK